MEAILTLVFIVLDIIIIAGIFNVTKLVRRTNVKPNVSKEDIEYANENWELLNIEEFRKRIEELQLEDAVSGVNTKAEIITNEQEYLFERDVLKL